MVRSPSLATKICSGVLPRLTNVVTNSGLPFTQQVQVNPSLWQKDTIKISEPVPFVRPFVNIHFFQTQKSSIQLSILL